MRLGRLKLNSKAEKELLAQKLGEEEPEPEMIEVHSWTQEEPVKVIPFEPYKPTSVKEDAA